MLCLQPRLRVSRLPSSQSESLSQPLSLCRRRRVRATDRGMTVHASNNQLELSFNSLPLLAAAAAVASPASLSRASSSTDQVVRSLQKAPCETVCTNGRKMALLHCCAAEEAQFQEKMICLTCKLQRPAAGPTLGDCSLVISSITCVLSHNSSCASWERRQNRLF